MRGTDTRQEGLFSYVSSQSRIPEDHPLREIRRLTDEALAALSADFEAAYSPMGRPSIAPEKLIRTLLLQLFYTVRSERLLMEQLDYNLLFRWFVGLGVDEPVWVPTVFTHNRERLLEAEIVHRLFAEVLAKAKAANLTSDEHFSVDGTLIEAWASMKSFRPKDEPPTKGGGRNREIDFRGETRTNDTHESTTDLDCRLYKKAHGQAAKLCHLGHLMMENRNGFIVDTAVTPPSGYAVSLRIRKLIETRFGWMKDIGTMRKTKRRGTTRVDEQFRLNAAAFNLLHLANLLRASPA